MELLKAPIAGQSLTDESKNFPWENPPEISDPEEAIAMHLSKFNDPVVIDNMLDLLDMGFPVRSMAESILTASVSAGWHSIDVSLVIAPFMHEHIKSIANESGVRYVEGLDEPEAEKEAKKREQLRAKVAAALKNVSEEEQDAGYTMAMEALNILDKPESEYETLSEEAPVMEEPMVDQEETKPQMQSGLMARG
jgi:hypothetical protein|tara:strand:+ start:92 stop:673 length:582 start_codon:yes stop_codon:yes gene_type:complete